MTEVFTLSWDEFNQKCPKVFKDLWLDTDLSDVTLATEDGGQFSAHKVILAACSPLFKRLLQKSPTGHPLLLYLMGVQLSQLQQLLSYIYLGQCDLTQDQLPAFMATGKQLEVEGLSGYLDESKEHESRTRTAGDLDSPVDAKIEVDIQALQMKSQIETTNEEHLLTYEGAVPVIDGGNETASTITVKDSSKAWKCQQCDYKTLNRAHLRVHTENVHEGFKYDCTNCDYKSGNKSNLKRHVEKDHLGITYTCELCKQIFNDKNRLKRHVDVKHNELLFKCDNCQYKSANKSYLENHILVQHNGVTFDCSICQHKSNSK